MCTLYMYHLKNNYRSINSLFIWITLNNLYKITWKKLIVSPYFLFDFGRSNRLKYVHCIFITATNNYPYILYIYYILYLLYYYILRVCVCLYECNFYYCKQLLYFVFLIPQRGLKLNKLTYYSWRNFIQELLTWLPSMAYAVISSYGLFSQHSIFHSFYL